MNSRNDQPHQDISADRPGNDPTADRLGYAPFAKRLAQSISGMPRADGQVLALYGGWGFGKTTMLNYVRHYLSETEAANRPFVISFNPWWFSGHEDLVRAFFGQLSAKVKDRKEFSSEVRTRLADFAEAVSDIPLPYFSWGKMVGKAVRPKPKDIEKLKNEISAALREQPHRILVIIDDIDRLTSEEIRQVFRAVKSVGDFPNVTYLIAFDKAVVVRSLGQIQGGSGEDYLEKIVQVPFELPLVDRLSIRGLFFEQVNAILAGIETKTFDQTYWGNIFLEGIDKFLDTPRDAIRLTSALGVTFRAVAGEVNPVDFIAIEALRMFCPEAYDTIRSNGEKFTGSAPDGPRLAGGTELRQFHDRWIGRIHETSPTLEKPIRDMVQRLFPRLQAVWGNTHFGPEWNAEWRRGLRVCSETVFPVYFSLAIPTGEISNADMQALLKEAGTPERFGAEILRLAKQLRPDGKSRAAAFMVRLQDYTTTGITIDQVEPVISVLFDVGDQLMGPDDASQGIFDLGVDVQVGRVVWQLLKRAEPPRRFEILKAAFQSGRALYLIQKALIVLGQQQGLYGERASPPEEWFTSAEQLAELDGIFVEKIRRSGQDGSLLGAPKLLLLLGFWREKAGEDEVRTWVTQISRDDGRLLRFLEGCLLSSSSLHLGDSVGRRHDRLDPNWLKPYIDADPIVNRARKLRENEQLTDRQSRAVNQLLREYDFRKRGGNPDDPLAQDEIGQ